MEGSATTRRNRRLRAVGRHLAAAPDSRPLLFVGSFTDVFGGRGDGISSFRLEPSDGALEPTAPPLDVGYDPSNLALHPQKRILYYGCEGNDYDHPYDAEHDDRSAVGCCAIKPDGALTPLNRISYPGSPAQVQVDRSGRWLLAANYLGGTVTVFSLESDGTLGSLHQTIVHADPSAVDETRQLSAHCHMITLDATNRFCLVADLGTDACHTYRFDETSGELQPLARVALPPGSGPRHMCFHPSQRWIFVLHELSAMLSVHAFDAETGELGSPAAPPLLQLCSEAPCCASGPALHIRDCLPADFTGGRSGADLHVHPNGRWVYSSNRGHDTIVRFEFDAATATLSPAREWSAGGGAGPRNFCILPGGRVMLVANSSGQPVEFGEPQVGGNVTAFHIGADGGLEPTGAVRQVGTPVWLMFVQDGWWFRHGFQ